MSFGSALLFSIVASAGLYVWINNLPGSFPKPYPASLRYWPGKAVDLAILFWLAIVLLFVVAEVRAFFVIEVDLPEKLLDTLLFQIVLLSIALGYSLKLKDSFFLPLSSWPLLPSWLGRWTLLAIIRFLPVLWIASLLWYGTLIALEYILGDFNFREPQMLVEALRDSPSLGLILVSSFLVLLGAPILEEVVFRGILYRALRNHLSFRTAALICSLLFSLLHFSTLQFVPLIVLSFALCHLLEATRDLRACILFHSLFNLFSLLLILSQ
ncbi:MAG: lysostaphin resistance A-like protein [Puniceicoccaceae bacterium]